MVKYLGLGLLMLLLLLAGGIGGVYLGAPAKLLDLSDQLLGGSPAELVAEGHQYGTSPRQRLDVWATPSNAGTRPVIVFVHGGGWNSGGRSQYGFAARAFADQGYVVVVPSYRLVPETHFPGFIEDCAKVMRWVQDHIDEVGGDSKRVMLIGHSAGAHIALMLALDPRYLAKAGFDTQNLRAVISLAGPADFYPFTTAATTAAMASAPDPQLTQPLHFARAGAPPLLLLHGSADTVVKPRNSEALSAAIKKLGGDVTLKLYPGASHNDLVMALAAPFRDRVPVLADSAAFLLAHEQKRQERERVEQGRRVSDSPDARTDRVLGN